MQDVTAKFEFIVEQDKHNPNICNQVDYENELNEFHEAEEMICYNNGKEIGFV